MSVNRRKIASILLPLLTLVGCGRPVADPVTDPPPPNNTESRENASSQLEHGNSATVDEAIDWVGERQRRALKDATVVVHRAYEYHGESWYEVPATHKVIAVDVEIADYFPGIDLDDFDILNGSSHENYGSDPQILGLTEDYTQAVERESNLLPEDLSPLRRLLLYAVPRDWKSIKLGYWKLVLTAEPTALADSGPILAEDAEPPHATEPAVESVPKAEPLAPAR